MDLTVFLIISAAYIMIVHFAVAISKEFKLWVLIAIFIFAGVVGHFLHSYEFALFIGIILSLVLW